jgi:hypothetical protein
MKSSRQGPLGLWHGLRIQPFLARPRAPSFALRHEDASGAAFGLTHVGEEGGGEALPATLDEVEKIKI